MANKKSNFPPYKKLISDRIASSSSNPRGFSSERNTLKNFKNSANEKSKSRKPKSKPEGEKEREKRLPSKSTTYETVEFSVVQNNGILVKPSNGVISKLLCLKKGAKYSIENNSWEISFNHYENLVKHLRDAKIEMKELPAGVSQLFCCRKETTCVDFNTFSASHPIFQKLFPFQIEAVLFALNRNGRVLLADDMGLGKTIQALAIAQYYSTDFPLLIISPASLLVNWKESVKNFLGCDSQIIRSKLDFGENISVISYAMATKFSEIIKNLKFNIIICDECHYFKNHKAGRTQKLLPVLTLTSRLIMISGTPALSRPIELFPIIMALKPSLFPNYNQYGARYCDGRLVYIRGLNREVYDFKGSSNAEELRFVLQSEMMVRRLKSFVLHELPPKSRRHVVIDVESKNTSKAPFKLHGGPDKFLGDIVNTEIMAAYSQAAVLKKTPVLSYLDGLLDKNIKFIVFAHHLAMLDSIDTHLCDKKIEFIRIDGNTLSTKRFEYVEAFQNNESIRVALLSLTACSTGITLTSASSVVFAELFWNPGTLLQAEDRIYRIGQKRNVDIHYLICKHTIDEIVWPKLLNKMDVLEKLGVGENAYSKPEYNKKEIKNILKNSK